MFTHFVCPHKTKIELNFAENPFGLGVYPTDAYEKKWEKNIASKHLHLMVRNMQS